MRPTHHQQVLPNNLVAATGKQKRQMEVSSVVVESAAMDAAGVFARLATSSTGLTTEETTRRLAKHGPNVLSKDQRAGIGKLLWNAVINPLVILLLVLTAVSFATGDARAGVVMSLMIVLGSGLKLIQEARADSAAAKLKAMISVTATVLRDGKPEQIAVAQLVPGDVVQLSAGDMIPGDVRLIEAKDLFVSQGVLTGETFPVEKFAAETRTASSPLELTNIAFLGTSENMASSEEMDMIGALLRCSTFEVFVFGLRIFTSVVDVAIRARGCHGLASSRLYRRVAVVTLFQLGTEVA